MRPCTHLQGVPRDDQGTVMLPAEGIQLQVGFASVGHLEGEVTRRWHSKQRLSSVMSVATQPKALPWPQL